MGTAERPLISCVMVTQSRRAALARQAIASYLWQSYEPRELVIITDDPGLEELYTTAGPTARVYPAAPGAPLGALRNQALAAARGALVCQWDDDDQYHPQRLALQYQALTQQPGAVACCLTDQLYLMAPQHELYWVDWRQRPPHVLIPGTVLAQRTCAQYPEDGPRCRRGEDDVYLAQLRQAGVCVGLPDLGWCYLRTYHGHNTWEAAHFWANIRRLGRPAAALVPQQAAILAALPHYMLPAVTICGRDGPVIRWSP